MVCLDVARRLEHPNDPYNSAMPVVASCSWQVQPSGIGLLERGLTKHYPGHPGWVFGTRLTTLLKNLVTNYLKALHTNGQDEVE